MSIRILSRDMTLAQVIRSAMEWNATLEALNTELANVQRVKLEAFKLSYQELGELVHVGGHWIPLREAKSITVNNLGSGWRVYVRFDKETVSIPAVDDRETAELQAEEIAVHRAIHRREIR